MEQRVLGRGPARLSRIGLGTWRVRDHAATCLALQAGVAAGLTHIDTAELYEQQSGSETMLGRWLQSSPHRRDSLFLASKVLPHHATYDGTLAACHASLQRLGIATLDLYYLHWRGAHALEETCDALAQLVEDGKVRHVGVSNFDVADLEEVEGYLGKGVLAANQVLYHLEDRGAESEVIPWCKAHGVTVVAYSPFGAGAFVTSAKRRALLEQVANDAGRTPRQTALAYLTREAHAVAIPKTESAQHARELAGGDHALTANQVRALDEAFPARAGLRTI